MKRFGRLGAQFGFALVAASIAYGCSSNTGGSGFAPTPSGGSVADAGGADGSGSSGSSSGGSSGGSGGYGAFGDAEADSSGTTTTGCNVTDVNADSDKDGWSIAEGDCNDCDPNVNPGAIDVLVTPGDGGAPYYTNNDCSGKLGDGIGPCDTGIPLTDTVAGDGAEAIELCRIASPDGTPHTATGPTFGVLASAYTRANGAAFASPNLQVGIQASLGTNVQVQKGANMLMLSSGHARTPSQSGSCGSNTCAENATGTAPTGFPQNTTACPPSTHIDDDVALQLKLRAPTNATGYSFDFKFYSFEYPYWVCNSYNDQFIALVSPAPTGAINGNIAFDSNKNPVSVNLGFFNVCNPSDLKSFAEACAGSGSTCPTAPSPYCPAGDSQLLGTGFDVWEPDTASKMAGATSWLTTQAPVTGGEEFTISFIIFDTGDQAYDSSVLIDNFQWIATPGQTVTISTNPSPPPAQ
jgi:hypothetical protein